MLGGGGWCCEVWVGGFFIVVLGGVRGVSVFCVFRCIDWWFIFLMWVMGKLWGKSE